MLRIITAMVTAVALWAGAIGASAEMVDIGTGRMDRDEFLAVAATVAGGRLEARPTVVTPLPVTERFGPVEMAPAAFAALRRMVAGTASEGQLSSITTPPPRTVDIGTGRMPLDDFLALKRMVGRPLHRLGNAAMAVNP